MAHAGDDGFHEIQLSGKQLVFLCMATTVVAVLIFLTGVLVGRGVRTEKALNAAPPDVVAAPQAGDAGAEDADAQDAADPPPLAAPAEGLTYPNELEGKAQPQDALKSSPASPPPAADTPPPTVAPVPDPAPTRPAGWAVQVTALRDRDEADAIVKRLTAKGYPAFLLDPAPGAPASVYRVRVGTFRERKEAEAILRRMEKEEKFKPWITR